jgi:hypothetical protein
MSKNLKNIQVIVEDLHGVCLWRMPDGSCLGDDEGRYLSVEGQLNDPVSEAKMRDAAIHYLGSEALEGRAVWMSGSRKISDNEYDDQTERLLDGHIPDVVDIARQLERNGSV